MSFPAMQLVSSSCIFAVGYDAGSQTVFVAFLNGSIYAYEGVPEYEFENLRTAPSVGSYFNRSISNVYPSEHVGNHASICVSNSLSGAEVVRAIETTSSSSAEGRGPHEKRREAIQKEIEILKTEITDLTKMLEEKEASLEALTGQFRGAPEKPARVLAEVRSATKESNAKLQAATDYRKDVLKMHGAVPGARTLSIEGELDEVGQALLELASAYTELGITNLADFLSEVRKEIGPVVDKLNDRLTAAWNHARESATTAEQASITDGLVITDDRTIGRVARALHSFVIRRDGLNASAKGRKAAVDAVHEILVDFIPEFTRGQTVRAMVGIGVYSEQSDDDLINSPTDDDEDSLELVMRFMLEPPNDA